MDLTRALGPHADLLRVHSKRAELLANNLANQDTPGFKAQDLDFKAVMNTVLDKNQPNQLRQNAANHMSQDTLSLSQTVYRQPSQPSLDGNTVDAQTEQAAYVENAMGYMANLSFINQRFKDLNTAIKGD